MYMDGSDVGLSGSGARDVDAFHMMGDGSILLSFAGATTIPDVGSVDDSDIVRFVPTSLGTSTAGTYEMYFDGSDVELTTNGEDIDAVAVLANGDIIISTRGNATITSVSRRARDEDLLRFVPTSLGANTSGSWSLYFDGSDVGLTASSEDIHGTWVAGNGDIYLTTTGVFAVAGAGGDGADVLLCVPASTGNNTSCSFNLFWDGSANGYGGEVMDGMAISLP